MKFKEKTEQGRVCKQVTCQGHHFSFSVFLVSLNCLKNRCACLLLFPELLDYQLYVLNHQSLDVYFRILVIEFTLLGFKYRALYVLQKCYHSSVSSKSLLGTSSYYIVQEVLSVVYLDLCFT